MLNNRQFQVILTAFILLVIACIAFQLALSGQANALNASREISCVDWNFHVCYAKSLCLKYCSVGYLIYPAGVHALAFIFQGVVNVNVFLVVWLALMMALTAFLVLKHGNSAAFFLYFIFFPFFMAFVLQKAPYLWVDMAYCGLVPYVTLTALALWLLLEWKELGNWRIPLFLYALTVHNYSWVLLSIVLTALILRDVTKKWWVLFAVPIAFSFIAGYGGLGDFASRLFVFFLLCLSVLVGNFLSNYDFNKR